MNRMTYRSDDGSCCFLHCMHCEGDNCKCCNEVDNAADRLAAYEDTGLTPGDLQGHGDIDFRRVVELLRSDAEGRLVVLPCKVGTPVYFIATTKHGYRYVKEDPFEIEDFAWFNHHFGKTVFLTRQEAEAALVTDKNVGCKHGLQRHKNEIGEDEVYCELTAQWMNVSLGDCLGNCEAEVENYGG